MSTINRVRYIRGINGEKTGVIEVLYENGKFGVGISLCNTKIDKFNREVGKDIAHQRAVNCREKTPLLLKDLINFNIEEYAGCKIPRAVSIEDAVFGRTSSILRAYDSIVYDMVYTLALSKVRSETA